jgi:serine/threonine protein kinase
VLCYSVLFVYRRDAIFNIGMIRRQWKYEETGDDSTASRQVPASPAGGKLPGSAQRKQSQNHLSVGVYGQRTPSRPGLRSPNSPGGSKLVVSGGSVSGGAFKFPSTDIAANANMYKSPVSTGEKMAAPAPVSLALATPAAPVPIPAPAPVAKPAPVTPVPAPIQFAPPSLPAAETKEASSGAKASPVVTPRRGVSGKSDTSEGDQEAFDEDNFPALNSRILLDYSNSDLNPRKIDDLKRVEEMELILSENVPDRSSGKVSSKGSGSKGSKGSGSAEEIDNNVRAMFRSSATIKNSSNKSGSFQHQSANFQDLATLKAASGLKIKSQTPAPVVEEKVPEKPNPNAELNSAVGTAHFMAPEIITDRIYDKSVDWWACGVTFYYCVTGQHLFRGSEPNAIFRSIIKADIDLTKLDTISSDPNTVADYKSLQSLITGLLERDYTKRFGSGSMNAIKNHEFWGRNVGAFTAVCSRSPTLHPQQLEEVTVTQADKAAGEDLFFNRKTLKKKVRVTTTRSYSTIGQSGPLGGRSRKHKSGSLGSRKSKKLSNMNRFNRVANSIRDYSIAEADEDDEEEEEDESRMYDSHVHKLDSGVMGLRESTAKNGSSMAEEEEKEDEYENTGSDYERETVVASGAYDQAVKLAAVATKVSLKSNPQP